MPHLIDITGTFCRPENEFYLTGDMPEDDPAVALDDFEARHEDFEDHIWPNLAHRIPQFEAIKLRRYWTGHYDFNLLDYNAIVGRHPRVRNFIFVNGFSGHGLQQAPAVGRAVAEQIVYGRYETLDFASFGFERVEAGEPLFEAAII
jgi:glycine/D-amino acid oxidase-like deaminating enzyme